MFANVLDLATVAAHCVWAIEFEADSLAKKDARSPFIQCTSKSLILTYMKRRLMQTKTERAFLHWIQISVRRIELESEGHQSLQMPRASRVRQASSEPGTSGQAAGTSHKRQASSQPGTLGQAASTRSAFSKGVDAREAKSLHVA